MSVVHTRLGDEYIKTLDQLAKVRGTSRSKEIREAIKMYLAEYTGEPDMNNMVKRLTALESRFNEFKQQIEAILHDLRY